MSRRRQIQKQPAVSLFPFLAVLICTMGTLIVLLVVVVQQARKTGATGATGATAASVSPAKQISSLPVIPLQSESDGIVISIPQVIEPSEGVKIAAVASEQTLHQLEDIEWANEQLAKSREETRLDLEERRGALGRIEDQVRALNEQLTLLETQAQALLDTEANQFAPSEKAALELENARAAVIETKKVLAAKQAEAAKQHKKYAILPFDGRNGTRRRPIYIECNAEGVVLQPEGIKFGARDFSVLNAANPLAAMLRAYREYLSNAGLIEAAGEPYPLIIVRPNGERAYRACKYALKSWDDEFGYELVPTEMELEFSEIDGGLAAFLREAVAAARLRIPSNIAGLGGRASVPGGAGGSVLGGRGTGVGGTPGNPGSGGGARDSRLALGSPSGGSGSKSEAPTYSLGKGIGGGLVLDSGTPSAGPRSIDSGRNSRRHEILRGARRASGQTGSRSENASYSQGGGSGGTGQTAAANATGRGDGFAQQASSLGSSAAGQAAGGGSGSSSGASGGGQDGGASGSQGSQASQASPGGSPSSSGSPGSASASTQSTPVRSAAGLAGDESEAGASSASLVKTFAETQGANWALPNAANGSIGISRPIMAWFENNRMVIRSDRGQIAVPIENGSIDESVQPLVTKVWEIIDGWGIAGSGAYWKPILHVRVQSDAEHGFERFLRLMQDSGLEIQRRK